MKDAVKIFLAAAFSILAFISQAADVRTSLSASDTRGEYSFMSVEAGATNKEARDNQLRMNTLIKGTLSFPGLFGSSASAANKVPAVVLIHGSNGPNKSVKAWADYLHSQGVATFILDAFSGRGITNTMEDQSQITHTASGVDPLMALKLLSTHPFIDSSKIAVMGFSKGATAAKMAALQFLNDAALGKNSPIKFAGHIEFYGGCNNVGKTTGAPILMLIGEADDYVRADACRHTYEILKQSGANIKLITYPDAYHGFDTGNPFKFHSNFQALDKCAPILEADTGQFFVPNAQDPLTSIQGRRSDFNCPMVRGAHTGGNDLAFRASKEEVSNFVKMYLKN